MEACNLKDLLTQLQASEVKPPRIPRSMSLLTSPVPSRSGISDEEVTSYKTAIVFRAILKAGSPPNTKSLGVCGSN